MGYRSSVKALVYPDAPEDPMINPQFKEYNTEKYGALKLLLKTTFGHLMANTYFDETCFEFDDRREHLVFTAEDTKWYDGYDDVKAFHQFLLDVTELGYCTEFARVGEDVADIEEATTGNDLEYRLRVSRSIDVE